jgi:hypothetical protein
MKRLAYTSILVALLERGHRTSAGTAAAGRGAGCPYQHEHSGQQHDRDPLVQAECL